LLKKSKRAAKVIAYFELTKYDWKKMTAISGCVAATQRYEPKATPQQ